MRLRNARHPRAGEINVDASGQIDAVFLIGPNDMRRPAYHFFTLKPGKIRKIRKRFFRAPKDRFVIVGFKRKIGFRKDKAIRFRGRTIRYFKQLTVIGKETDTAVDVLSAFRQANVKLERSVIVVIILIVSSL